MFVGGPDGPELVVPGRRESPLSRLQYTCAGAFDTLVRNFLFRD